MMRAAARRGHAVFAAEARHLALADGRVRVLAAPVEPQPEDDPWYRAGPAAVRPMTDFRVALMRTDPPFDMDYVTATWLLELAEAEGVAVVNRPAALRDFNEKLAIARFPHLAPPTCVTARMDDVRAFLAEHGDIVVKPLDAMGGSGVFRLRPGDPNLSVVLETLTAQERRAIMAQRYLPAIAQGDKRILLVDGEPAPYCLARIPREGETRGNLAAGGRGEARPLTDADRALAAEVGPVLRERGLLLVGLDVIGDRLTEINVTSPTCMVEIAAQTGFSVAERVVDMLEARWGA